MGNYLIQGGDLSMNAILFIFLLSLSVQSLHAMEAKASEDQQTEESQQDAADAGSDEKRAEPNYLHNEKIHKYKREHQFGEV